MRLASSFLLFLLLISFASCSKKESLDQFVLIKGSEFKTGRGAEQSGALKRVEDFEMLDHPVTNEEYREFIKETHYPAPLHWKDDKIPKGKKRFPVIFVNRQDVQAFLDWASKKHGREYRLPTSVEFEYAARGGLVDQPYPWGYAAPDGNANFNADGSRHFEEWKAYLQPASIGNKNGFGLYGMAGNVWQMIADNHDPETTRFKYRIDALYEIESGVMGGSWARSKEYLQCGYRLGISAGIRYPDLGFRPVRAPVGKDWRIQPRKGSAMALADGQVLLTWALLATDTAHTRFNVYMATERSHAGFLQNTTPLSTPGYVDENAEPGQRYYYYVKPVDAKGEEGRRSEWWGITISSEPSAVITQFHPVHTQGALVPIFGDLNGDGKLDCVIRMDNGNSEMSQDPGVPVRMEAFTSYGRSLWRKDICNHDQCFGSANNVPFNVWDMDGDGKAEVITRLQQGEAVFVAILDGMTGKVKYQAPWPDMVSDFAKSSTRIHLSIAYLDGKTPAVITQTGLYENEVFAAYDHQLNEVWRFDSFAETNGSGGHAISVADVDGDGKHEVFNGTTCLNADGSLRWSIYRQHPDLVSVHDFLPERPGLEVFYIVESSVHAGVYLVDANTGTVIWKVNREDDPRWTHGHTGWAADIWDGAAGIECVSNRAGHDDTNLVLFSAEGQVLLEPFPFGYQPFEWDGDPTRELLRPSDMTLYDFDGKTLLPHPLEAPRVPAGSSFVMAADLYGDFRDELVVVTKIGNQNGIAVISATTPTEKKFITPTQSLDYRLWLGRNMGGGYRTVYDMPLMGLK